MKRARFFADHAENVRSQGAEYLAALADGLIGPDHLIGEIGEVLDGRVPGRRAADDITVYKSLGHIAQDLKAGAFLLNSAVGTPITLD